MDKKSVKVKIFFNLFGTYKTVQFSRHLYYRTTVFMCFSCWLQFIFFAYLFVKLIEMNDLFCLLILPNWILTTVV